MQPDGSPAPEHAVHIVVITRQLVAHVGCFVERLCVPDALYIELLDERQWRHDDETGDVPSAGAGVDQRHRGTGGMTDEHRSLYRQRGLKGGEDFERLFVHEAWRVRRTARRRAPKAISRIGDDATACRSG